MKRELNKPNLAEIFERWVAAVQPTTTTCASAKSHLTKFAVNILGCPSLAECELPTYNLSKNDRNALIEQNVQSHKITQRNPTAHLKPGSLANLKSSVNKILDWAHSQRLLPPPAPSPQLTGQTTTNNWRRKPIATCKEFINFHHHENQKLTKYTLAPVPAGLDQELTKYRDWSTREYQPYRRAKLKKREVSFNVHSRILLRLAGYLHHFRNLPKDELTLTDLCKPEHLEAFVQWHSEQHGKVTATCKLTITCVMVLIEYLNQKKKEPLLKRYAEEIREIDKTTGHVRTTRDKRTRVLSLAEIDSIGRSLYPANGKYYATRLLEGSDSSYNAPADEVDEGLGQMNSLRNHAVRVLQSLLLQLLVRRPMRQRNLREMRYAPNAPANGQNLYLDGHGGWQMRFCGQELKVALRQGKENILEYDFPRSLRPLLDEWLTIWRPLLIRLQAPQHRGAERSQALGQGQGQEYVFLNGGGLPLTLENITRYIKRATYCYTRRAVNPHLIRSIFATEYIRDTRNVALAAYLLGDDIATVMKHYYDIFQNKALVPEVDDWLEKQGNAQPQNHLAPNTALVHPHNVGNLPTQRRL